MLLLPEDPDASALAIATALRASTGKQIGVILSDTLGRPWREGQTDAAIGAAGLRVVDDLRGTTDASGHLLEATIAAVADEIAGAADLVKRKASGMPVAIVRGLGHLVGDLDLPGARALIRPADQDMFRLGSDEAWREGYEAGLRAAAEFESRISSQLVVRLRREPITRWPSSPSHPRQSAVTDGPRPSPSGPVTQRSVQLPVICAAPSVSSAVKRGA